jgi:hypothetical protein
MSKINTRVGAILGAGKDTVEFLGYGVYVGDFVPTEAAGDMGKMLAEAEIPNPKIVLDSGKIVYGCECWWGSEEAVQKKLAGYKTVTEVDIDEIRKKFPQS